MEFTRFKNKLQKSFESISMDVDRLFEIDVDKDYLWNLYLDSFPEGTNKIYRERREYDCNACRRFIKNFGNVVTIKNGVIHTIWEFNPESDVFDPVTRALDEYIKSNAVTNYHVSKECMVGIDKTRELLEDGSVVTWEHLSIELPARFVDNSYRTIPDIQGEQRDIRNVFKRSLDEISQDSIETIMELINTNTLYKGMEWKSVLTTFLKFKKEYDKLNDSQKDIFAWEFAAEAGVVIGKIKNHSIGTLLVDVTNGVNLEDAVKRYEQIVAPSNYKRPKAIYTKKMLEDARKKIEELGFMESLGRRYATLDDITVNNILFINRDVANRIGGSIFDKMASDIPVDPKKFSRVEEIPIDKFINDVLPTSKSIEVFMENRHTDSMVSLIAPKDRESKSMFKWNNGFSWAYSGNMTDSILKENVKAAGGKVDGDLRFSIQWNDGFEFDQNDLDAHCIEPDDELYFGHGKAPDFSYNRGQLDVDIIHPINNKPAVENIIYGNRKFMKPGNYTFYVHCYSGRSGRSGFRTEVEYDGEIHSYNYTNPLFTGNIVKVATVTVDSNRNFTIKHHLQNECAINSKEVWGIKTNQFVPVSVIMNSPNYWDEQEGIGHKHYFFMLDGCKNDETPNGFYNEFLNNEMNPHRKVLEALGAELKVEDSDEQLSGIGFSSTKRNDVIVRVKGRTERIMKIKF